MLPKGAGSIRSLHSLNTRPGAQTPSEILRRMYILTCEEEHLEKKTKWLESQNGQTQRRLGEISHAKGFLQNKVSKKEKETMKGNLGGRFNSVPLTY